MKERRLKKWIHYLLIDDKSEFESHIISTILLSSGVFCLVNSIPNLFLTIAWQVTLTVFLIGVYSIYAYYQKRFRQKFSLIFCLIFINTALSVLWFFTNGINGYAPLGFVVLMIVLILTHDRKLHSLLISLIIANLLLLTIIGNYFPRLFQSLYTDQAMYKFDIQITTPTLILLIAFCLSYAKRSYDNEKLKNKLQKEEILDKNIQLEMQKGLIENASEKRTKFFINMAHETRTPLTLIKNYLDLYIQKYGNNDEINIVNTNVERLIAGMINYLDTEKYELGMAIYNHNQLLNVSMLLVEKCEIFEKYASNYNLKLRLNIEENIILAGDPLAVDRIINNLLENAIKFSPQGGTIKVKLKLNEKKIELSVKDEGIGIPVELQDKIFEPFYQISRDKHNLQGLGMGLSLVKNIMDELCGKILIESQEGKGSEFKLIFNKPTDSNIKPVVNHIIHQKPTEPEWSYENVVDTIVDPNWPYILIVEDNKQMMNYLHQQLIGEFNIITAENGLDALQKMKSQQTPDLILSDIMMDEMDGFTFLKELSMDSSHKFIPLIFITAKTSQKDSIEGLSLGAVDFIQKPFNYYELRFKIKSILSNSASQKEAIMNEIVKTASHQLKRKIDSDLHVELHDIFKTNCAKYKFTAREIEILELIAQGLPYKNISEKMNISERTVVRHVQNMFQKTQTHNKLDLINLISKS
jgi:signal transduction histidine kinase/DNA-binding NarL/FixJ family response regulator